MNKIDPIIAVKDVNAGTEWYKEVFEWKRIHGGDEFAVLVSEKNEVMLCLHAWGEHNHPSMENPGIKPGSGLILYFKTDNLDVILRNIKEMNYPLEENLHRNPNSLKNEFSLYDPDGYFIIVTEYHEYEG